MLLRETICLGKRRHRSLKKRRSRGWCFLCLMLALPLMLWLGYKLLSSLEPPQAVLVLGGSTPALEREKFAAQLGSQHPDLQIWVSGGGTKIYTERVFDKAGIERSRLHLDYKARDTVTNFTTLVDELQARGIKRVYLVTSDYHMRRARVVGEIVFGSRGIVLKPVPVPTERSPEPIEKAMRDGARALLWVTTGHTGAKLVRGRG